LNFHETEAIWSNPRTPHPIYDIEVHEMMNDAGKDTPTLEFGQMYSDLEGLLTYIAYPVPTTGATVHDESGARATAILYPCAHPVMMTATNPEILQFMLLNGLPIRCKYCLAQMGKDGDN
jgi:hypothetical protein